MNQRSRRPGKGLRARDIARAKRYGLRRWRGDSTLAEQNGSALVPAPSPILGSYRSRAGSVVVGQRALVMRHTIPPVPARGVTRW
jgi:hypothetical protein